MGEGRDEKGNEREGEGKREKEYHWSIDFADQ